MEIKGHIIHVLAPQSGTSKATGKEWKIQEYVLETDGQYPSKVCFQLSGARIEQYPVEIGDEVVVSYDLDSREYNGRWYTSVRAWKIEKASVVAGAPVPPDMGSVPPPAIPPAEAGDDLPF